LQISKEDTDHFQYNKIVLGSYAIVCCFVLQKDDSDRKVVY